MIDAALEFVQERKRLNNLIIELKSQLAEAKREMERLKKIAGEHAEYAQEWKELHLKATEDCECVGLREALEAYRKKREHDGLNGRTWNATKHLEAENAVIEAEQALKGDAISSQP